MERPVFTNPRNISGCHQCAEPGHRAPDCCRTPSGVYEDGCYDPAEYDILQWDPARWAGVDVGIRNPMERSEGLWKEALTKIPGGSQTFSKSPMVFAKGVAPKYLDHGRGSRVWDADGNQYIDYALGCFPMTLGYRNEHIDNAIREQLDRGITFSMMHEVEVGFARRFTEIVPGAEMVRYGKNGSDATSAAVRLARAVTGRDHVACFGYHGFQDWYIATTDRNRGVPGAVRELTHPFRYNDIESLRAVFDAHPGEIACVIMEPGIVEFPRDYFLAQVKEMAHDNGALLIFDEMITGFRFDLGGAQRYFGVIPDLAAFGKGIANGMPLGVLAGRAEYMRHFEEVFFSTTYGGEALSLAAGIAGMDFYREHDVVRRLWKMGCILFDNYRRLIRAKGMENNVSLVGYPVRSLLQFKDHGGEADYRLSTLFQQEMLKRGVICYATYGLSYVHTDEELMYTAAAFGEMLDVMKAALDDGDIGKFLDGDVTRPVFKGLREQKQTGN